MSVKDEQVKNVEEVVVNEVDTTELVELEKETKKAKVIEIAKKVGKIAGLAALAVGGFILGAAICGKSENNNSDVIDAEFEVEETDA